MRGLRVRPGVRRAGLAKAEPPALTPGQRRRRRRLDQIWLNSAVLRSVAPSSIDVTPGRAPCPYSHGSEARWRSLSLGAAVCPGAYRPLPCIMTGAWIIRLERAAGCGEPT